MVCAFRNARLTHSTSSQSDFSVIGLSFLSLEVGIRAFPDALEFLGGPLHVGFGNPEIAF
jgi:hypothetical protein